MCVLFWTISYLIIYIFTTTHGFFLFSTSLLGARIIGLPFFNVVLILEEYTMADGLKSIEKTEEREVRRINRGIIILILSSMILSGCDKQEEVAEEVKVDVETTYPVVRPMSLSGNFIGIVETDGKVSVAPRLSGQVTSKFFKVGDHVNAGDVLFTLDDREYQIEKKNAEANVRSANAALGAQKARNQETKAAATESVGTMNTKSLELYNSVMNSEREKYAAAIRKDGYCRDDSIYKSEEERIRNLIGDAEKKAAGAKEFSAHLNSIKDIYNKISSSDNPAETAKKYGVKDSDIGTETDPEAIAGIYLRTKTQYDSMEQLQTAIDASTETQKAAESDKNELDGSYNSNLIARIEAEVNAQVENGNIANAQDAKVLAEKMRLDYEIFSRMQIWADAQAKIAEGDAAVVTSDVQVVNAQTELETANLKIEYSTVRSPINGIIQEINIEQYGMASDQTPAYVISDPDKKKVVFYVAEDVRNNLSLNQKIFINKNGTDHEAYINAIADTADEQKKLYKIEAALGDDGQVSFMSGSSVKLHTGIKSENNAITIPIGAVYYSEGKPYVYVAENGKAVKKDIETGIFDETDIQVISGLTENDLIIVSWTSQLKDKSQINIKNKPAKVVVKAEEQTDESAGNNVGIKEGKQPEGEKVENAPIQVMIETTDRVNIRKSAGTDADKIETVSAGSHFTKISEENGWTRIIFNGQVAFIKSDYVRECVQ